MDFFGPHFFSGLLTVIVIDLALAGDNAIVIAMAARRLPQRLQTRAIAWGTLGAVVVRIAMTAAVLYLLKIPGLMLVGGLILLPIALSLMQQEDNENSQGMAPAIGFWTAMRIIVVADALMGLDNVLGIAGAAQGHLGLVVIGLLVSVPLVVWGSTLILKLLARFPAIVYVGAAAIAWTAARMMARERLIEFWFRAHAWAPYVLDVLCITTICSVGWWMRHKHERTA